MRNLTIIPEKILEKADNAVTPIPGFPAPKSNNILGPASKNINKTPGKKHPTGNDDWFYNKSEEEQKIYIEKHPNSKFAKNAKKNKPEEKTPATKTTEKKDLKHHIKKHAKSLSESIKTFNQEQKAFFRDGQYKPDSEARRSLSKLAIDKTKGIAKLIKHQGHEWKTAVNVLRKLHNNEKIDKHDKKALTAVAIQAGVVIGDMALTAGLGHAIVIGVGEIIHAFLHHSILEHTAKSSIWASTITGTKNLTIAKKEEKSDDELLEELIRYMAKGIRYEKIKQGTWVKAIEKHNRKEQIKKNKEAYKNEQADSD